MSHGYGSLATLSRGFDYASLVDVSERAAWRVDDVLDGRRFDASGPLVPASWVGAGDLRFLSDREHLVLNHTRAFSYVHLLGNFEEFAPLLLTRVVQDRGHDDRARLRALLRFSEEEVKHQQMFARAERLLEECCGHPFGRYFDPDKRTVAALSTAILRRSPLACFLMVLAFEWGTQRHYVETMRERSAEPGDALYADLLRAHWVEEAQHTKWDVLEVASLAGAATLTERAAAFDDVLELAALVDDVVAGQVRAEIATLEDVTGRRPARADRLRLQDALHRSLRRIVVEVGLAHPRFAAVAAAVSPAGAARLGLSAG